MRSSVVARRLSSFTTSSSTSGVLSCSPSTCTVGQLIGAGPRLCCVAPLPSSTAARVEQVGELAPGDGGADRIYWLAVILRLATQAWVVVMVVRDALRPERDPLRRTADDPTGGVLDGAVDVPWWTQLPARAGLHT